MTKRKQVGVKHMGQLFGDIRTLVGERFPKDIFCIKALVSHIPSFLINFIGELAEIFFLISFIGTIIMKKRKQNNTRTTAVIKDARFSYLYFCINVLHKELRKNLIEQVGEEFAKHLDEKVRFDKKGSRKREYGPLYQEIAETEW